MVLGNKRTAAEAARPQSPRTSAKRARTPSGAPRITTPPRPATPARPPRMPRCAREASTVAADRRLMQQLNRLSPAELVALVRDVEDRFRKLAAFEMEEIRRAQSLGFTETYSPAKLMFRTHLAEVL